MKIASFKSALAAFLAFGACGFAQTSWSHKVYKLVNVNSGKALDVTAYGTSLGDNIQQWDYNDTTNQKWILQNTGYNSSYALEAVNSAYVLDIRDWSTSNNYDNQQIQQWWKYGYYTASNQMWSLSHLGNGRYNIISVASGKYLAVRYSSSANGESVVQYSSSGGNEQKWDLYEATHAYSIPSYNPSFWNSDSYVRSVNNCYNYANNKRTDSFAQPGRSSGQMYSWPLTSSSQSDLYYSTNRDQLNLTTSTATAPNGQTKIALFFGQIWDGTQYVWDFHLYRKDSNGYWSHKPGQGNATNLDASGNAITNPEACNRGSYNGVAFYAYLVGYYFTPSDSNDGRGHGNVW